MAGRITAKKIIEFPQGTHFRNTMKRVKKAKRKPIGMLMHHDRDPAEELREKIGDIRKFVVCNNYVLYAIYERPNRTAGGIELPDTVVAEDEYQGKAGLILAVGPMTNLEADLRGSKLEPGMWIAVRPSAGWQIKINGVLCRMVEEKGVHLVIPTPDSVW